MRITSTTSQNPHLQPPRSRLITRPYPPHGAQCSALLAARPLLLRIVRKHALFHDSETQPPNNRSYNHRLKQKATCRSNHRIHIQSNVMIHIKYIISSPDFSIPGLPLRSPSDQDNPTPFFFLSSLLSHLCWSIRELSQLPSSLPHLIIRGPIPIRC